MTNEKYFPKTLSQWESDYGLFKNFPRIVVACDFSQSSFKLRSGILPLLTKYVYYLKTTCRIKLKFLLRTKLLKNLLLAKYLISVATPLHFPKIIEVFSVKYNRSIAFLRRLWSQSMRIKFRQKYGLVMQNKYLYIIFSVLRKNNRHSWRLNKSSKTF